MRGKRKGPSGVPIVRTGDQNRAHHCRKTGPVRSKNGSWSVYLPYAHAIKFHLAISTLQFCGMSSSSPKFREKRMSNDAIYFQGWRHGVGDIVRILLFGSLLGQQYSFEKKF